MIAAPAAPLGFETLRWRNGRIEMIDQRILPAETVYRDYVSAAGVAEAIRSMVIRGAPAIGCAAAYGVALEALRLAGADREQFDKGMEDGFAILANSRPTAVNLFWALKRMRVVLEVMSSDSASRIANRLLGEAHEILAEDIRINRCIGKHGAALLKDGTTVLTHCNAGALATAGYGTALGVIRSAIESGKRISVIADETRPYLQGARLTAWELVQDGIPVTLITDNMAGHLMKCGEIQSVVVGTDRVAANGDVANKIGTYMVAVLAHRHAIPFYVASPISTIDPDVPNGDAIPIEERDANEVTGYRGVRWAPEGIKVRNPSFDVTPAELVTAIITEHGVVASPNQSNIAALLQSASTLINIA